MTKETKVIDDASTTEDDSFTARNLENCQEDFGSDCAHALWRRGLKVDHPDWDSNQRVPPFG
eukprot:scaffold6485_cov172-Amphora_coffeaeformis.AAC.9